MTSKSINIALISFIVIIFIIYFISINMTLDKEIASQLDLAERYAKSENWDKTIQIGNEIKDNWYNYKHLISFNFAEAEFSLFENHINYIIGGAESEQLDTTLVHILAAKDLWQNIKRVIPEP